MRHINCELLIDFFNGNLDQETEEKFEKHLGACEDCQQELAELRELTADLPYMSEPINPPDGMKDRVLSNVLAEEQPTDSEPVLTEVSKPAPVKKKKGWVTPLIAAALFASVLGNIYTIALDEPAEEAAPEPAPEEPEEPTEVPLDKVYKSVDLSASEGINAEATASMIQKDDGVNLVVQANNLSELEGDQTYQVWVLEGGKPYRAGTFVPNEEGSGAVSYEVEYSGEHNWDTLAITVEPTPNSKTPQGEIILSSKL